MSHYEYQGDNYRDIILRIRECDRLLGLFELAGEYANPDSVKRIENFRTQLFEEAEIFYDLDEWDVDYDIENFECSKRTNPPAIRPALYAL